VPPETVHRRLPVSRPDPATHRIRVMFAIGALGTGGSEKQLTELLVRLPRDRFDPVLLTIDTGAPASRRVAQLRQAAVPIVSIDRPRGEAPMRWLALGRRYLSAVTAIDPGLVYAWLDETAAFLAPICEFKGIPCLVARRNLIGSRTERRYRAVARIMRWAEARATLVTANSAAVAAECVARGHEPARVRVVCNGHERLPPLSAAASNPVVFGYVAQFRAEKGHHRLIDALERMPPGPWRVDLAGDGPLRTEIQARVVRAQLGERVRFAGEIADAREFWRDRHVAILLSDSEGLPNAVLEAAFAGRPAIATRAGGTPEVIGDGGILVGLDDPGATAAAMTKLIDDPVGRERLGRAIWQHVADRHSIDQMMRGHLGALEETSAITARRRGREPRS
jgi:glycosyltransferase involved in cell wall biosynthesis